MTLDPATMAVYETKARQWTDARAGKDLGPARRLAARLVTGHGPALDLGCGPGYHTAELPDGTIGLDPAVAMLELLGHRVPCATAVRGEAASLPFRADSIGGAVVSAVYVHIERPALPSALAELHRVLAVDAPAELVLFEGDQELTEMRAGEFAGRRFALWPEPRLRDVVIGAGFDIVHWHKAESENWPVLSISVRRMRSLADTVGPGMRLLVCGLNPSPHAADTGVGFGRPGNRFWPAALAAGLVTVDRDPRHALAHHGIGMTDLVKRTTSRADEILGDEFRAGLDRLARLCAWLEPAAVCMVGLMGWRAAVDRTATVGWQPQRVGGAPVYVMPSTSGLNARSRLEDLTEHLRRASVGFEPGQVED